MGPFMYPPSAGIHSQPRTVTRLAKIGRPCHNAARDIPEGGPGGPYHKRRI